MHESHQDSDVCADADELCRTSAAQPVTACEAFRRVLAERPGPRRIVQLTGRFATEAVNGSDSELARFMSAEVIGRGHVLRLLLARPASQGSGARPHMARVAAQGARIRVTAGPLPNLASLAAELALVHTGSLRNGGPRIMVVHREATAALQQIQQTLWDHAEELPPPRRTGRPVQLDPAQLQVLRMLGSGMKDDAAARQMNVSVRTYRRHVATILRALGVSTRFEAGLSAAELGLLMERQKPKRSPELPRDLYRSFTPQCG
ncbi:helix-turn-helix transcriptional regulator [Streptomyces sp. NBC_01304]|uniref:helix-turn-helix transcriptional regulator n=1 Tax=Streptomyces sp. NBC_01304 TaxID=2903818 RepID=UPI002E122750|nr:LuxR C-terminal-related transcriptional regulator [Streptomyces sp. NBC_01304]